MADFDLVLQGTLVLPDRVFAEGYIAVRDGKIIALGSGTPPQARQRHLLGEAIIMPGAIDAQVHSLSQKNQEDFIWSTRSAAAGGVTTIVDMPYDEGDLICSAQAVRRKIDQQKALNVLIMRSPMIRRSGSFAMPMRVMRSRVKKYQQRTSPISPPHDHRLMRGSTVRRVCSASCAARALSAVPEAGKNFHAQIILVKARNMHQCRPVDELNYIIAENQQLLTTQLP